LDGPLNYQNDPNRPPLETVSLNGTVSSRALVMKTPTVHGEVQDLGAHYKLEGGNAEVQNIHAQLFGGRLDGDLIIHDVSGASQARLKAALKNVSIEKLRAASGNPSMQKRSEERR